MNRPPTPLIACLIVGITALFAYSYLGWFSRYMGDDYCAAGILASHGFLGMQRFAYLSWSGHFTSTFVLGLAGMIGPGIVPLLPAVTVGAWLLATAFAVREFLAATGGPCNVWHVLPASILLTFAIFYGAPDLGQDLLWQTGIVTYSLPLILLTLFLGIVAHQAAAAPGQPRPRLALLALFAACLAFVAGGLSETSLALQAGGMGLGVVATLGLPAPQRRTVRGLLLAGLAGSGAALMLLAISPANAPRQAHYPPFPGLPILLSLNIGQTVGFLGDYLSWLPDLLAAVIVVAATIGASNEMSMEEDQAARQGRRSVWLLGLPLVGVGMFSLLLRSNALPWSPSALAVPVVVAAAVVASRAIAAGARSTSLSKRGGWLRLVVPMTGAGLLSLFLRRYVLSWPPPVLAALIIVAIGLVAARAILRGGGEASERARQAGWLLVALPMSAIGLVALCLLPAAYAMSSGPPARALLVPGFLLVWVAAAWGYLAGRVLARPRSTWPRPQMVQAALLVAAIAVVAVTAFETTRDTFAQAPLAEANNARWTDLDARLRGQRDEGIRDIRAQFTGPATVRKLHVPSLGAGPLSEDPGHWFNQCLAVYYGVDSVAGE